MALIFYIDRETDPAYNLALEEVLANEAARQPFFMLWRNRPSIIVGRNQNTAAEIDSGEVHRLGLDVVRRITGGGAVYHDLGNLNYTIAAPGRYLGSGSFAAFARPVVEALRGFGVTAEFSGRNDILVNGRKISGSARSVLRDATLFHGTLLFDVDLSVLDSVLCPDPEKIKSKGVKSVRSRVLNLRELLPTYDMECFMPEFADRLQGIMGCAGFSAPPAAAVAAAEALAAAKYRTREWNYNTVFPYDCKVSRRFSCGGVTLELRIEANRIAAARLTGDFFGTAPAGELDERLTGVEYSPSGVARALAEADLNRYIAGISTADFMTLFDF